MFTGHFLKVLILFAAMVAMGLVGIFLASHFGITGPARNATPNVAGGDGTTAGVPPCETGTIC